MKDLAPAYIQKLFEQRLHGRGLQLQELAVTLRLSRKLPSTAASDADAGPEASALQALG